MSSIEHIENHEALIEDFYYRTIERGENYISLEKLQELKEKGITTEQFLDHVSSRCNYLFHGSQEDIDSLTSNNGKIFASDTAAIAIMRSIYSNRGVNLKYPYVIDSEHPLVLEIEPLEGDEVSSNERGFVYCIHSDGFKNEPEGSWQYVKEDDGVEIAISVETEKEDFVYPVEISKEVS